MKTLDLYIIRQFLTNFIMLFVVVMLLFVVVDFIVDVDEFVKAGQVHKDSWYGIPALATVGTIVDYYVPVVLLVYVFFNGLIVVGAMGFTIVGLQRKRELTAVIASGVSLYRVAAPVLIAGMVLSAVTLPVQEFILPPLAPKLVRPKSALSQPKKGLESKEVFFAQAGGGDLLSASRFDANRGELSGLHIIMRDETGTKHTEIKAESALWDDAQAAWVFNEGFAEKPLSQADAERATTRTKYPVESYATDLSPTVMLARRNALFASLLSIRTLEGLADNQAVSPAQRDKISQIISSRFSLMVLNVLLLVMALPFFLKRLPGDTLSSSLKAAGLCIGAWGGGLMMLQLSPGSLPVGGAALVAWLPVAMYLPVAAWLLQSVKT
ncbi:LptF/LptG family permease [Algisphaera agarilytica]|uniref:Lipopolysaccharide export LptBFGC system permease protein LptF n=1 Tax=Algisphaera agarilytica TaxID=1385975 RepID=A0A7X0LLX5_9BACT|nr:LptF/LptG family permease [Algisphaera agarilytica]MBB6431071.1 lipopolysaccharide export LptBFGC system permease protein LptF [Algisphaera agarilytica]